jgi:hypothetical protein
LSLTLSAVLVGAGFGRAILCQASLGKVRFCAACGGLAINLNAARALGLSVPLIMQMTADAVIE